MKEERQLEFAGQDTREKGAAQRTPEIRRKSTWNVELITDQCMQAKKLVKGREPPHQSSQYKAEGAILRANTGPEIVHVSMIQSEEPHKSWLEYSERY